MASVLGCSRLSPATVNRFRPRPTFLAHRKDFFYAYNHNYLFAIPNIVVDNLPLQGESARGHMAFIRKRGQSYYLVHNVRKKGRVRQLHLARLGPRPRISDEVIEGVTSKHPFVRVDWQGLKEKTLRQTVRPPEETDSQYLRALVSNVHNLNLDIAGLHFPAIQTIDRQLPGHLVSALKLLRTTLDVKLRSRKLPGLEVREARTR